MKNILFVIALLLSFGINAQISSSSWGTSNGTQNFECQAGYKKVDSAGTAQTDITFPKAFPDNGLISVTATLKWNYDISTNSSLTQRGLVIDEDITTTGFKVRGTGAVNILDGVNWIACWVKN